MIEMNMIGVLGQTASSCGLRTAYHRRGYDEHCSYLSGSVSDMFFFVLTVLHRPCISPPVLTTAAIPMIRLVANPLVTVTNNANLRET